MIEFVPLVALALLGSQVVAFIKFIVAGDKNGIVTTLTVWVASVVVLLAFANSKFAGAIPVGDYTLDTLDTWSTILVGLCVGGTGSGLYNFRKAIDNTDTAKEPNLIDG